MPLNKQDTILHLERKCVMYEKEVPLILKFENSTEDILLRVFTTFLLRTGSTFARLYTPVTLKALLRVAKMAAMLL